MRWQWGWRGDEDGEAMARRWKSDGRAMTMAKVLAMVVAMVMAMVISMATVMAMAMERRWG